LVNGCLPSDQILLDKWLKTIIQKTRAERKPLHPVIADFGDLIESDPEIIAPGGVILFAQAHDCIVGTCALMPKCGLPGRFELTKMAVMAQFQGRGIGRALLREIIDWFNGLKGRVLFLETNSRLYMRYTGECAPTALPRSQLGARP
jgi:GNAT superfamily N-acetyltransferase